MTENITSYTDKSSNINKRVPEDGTLIKDVDNIDFVINRSGDKSQTAVNQLNHFSEQILIIIGNYAIQAKSSPTVSKRK